MAHLAHHRAQQRPVAASCDPAICSCDELTACQDRHPAGRDLLSIKPRAVDLIAHWEAGSGLRLTFFAAGRVQSLWVDEAGMAAIRSELGITRSLAR